MARSVAEMFLVGEFDEPWYFLAAPDCPATKYSDWGGTIKNFVEPFNDDEAAQADNFPEQVLATWPS